MEEELKICSKEISIQLKELGFNWKSYNFYINDSNKVFEGKCLNYNDCYFIKYPNINILNNNKLIYYTAPSQQLAIKWLRNIHNIYIETPLRDWKDDNIKCFSYVVMSEKSNRASKFYNYRNIEDAEEASILKAIEIIKNKIK